VREKAWVLKLRVAVAELQIHWAPWAAMMTPSCHRTDIAVYVITAGRSAITKLSRYPSTNPNPSVSDMIAIAHTAFGLSPAQLSSTLALASLRTQLVIIFYLIFITCETCRKVKRSAWGVASTPRSTAQRRVRGCTSSDFTCTRGGSGTSSAISNR